MRDRLCRDSQPLQWYLESLTEETLCEEGATRMHRVPASHA